MVVTPRPSLSIDFTASLWKWSVRQERGWLFVSLPQDDSDHIRDLTAGEARRGFGAVRVSVLVGTTRWRTSIFPGVDEEPYALPIKQAVLARERLAIGDPVTVHLDVLDG